MINNKKWFCVILIVTLITIFSGQTFFTYVADSVTETYNSDSKKATETIYKNIKINIIPVKSVVLSKKTLSLKINEVSVLKAVLSPRNASNKDVFWISDNRKVVKVSKDGIVTAVGSGTTKVTAIAESGLKYAECSIKVLTTVMKPTPVTGVTLNKKTLTMNIKDVTVINATVSPVKATNKNIEFSIANTKIAAVRKNGTITALAKGTTELTVTTEDGNKTAACSLKVLGPPVSSLTLSKTKLTLKLNKTAQLRVVVKPSNAEDKSVIWSTSNKTIVTVDTKGKLTAKKVGKATITVKTKDGKKSVSCVVTVTK